MKQLLLVAAILGGFAVVLGAFGAHGLKSKISPEQLLTYQTGVTYQFYHVFAILAACLLYIYQPKSVFYYSAIFFTAGIVLFSGSIYLLALKDLIGIKNTRIIGPITPLGGLMFIVGWCLMAFGIIKLKF